ncbi:secreted protein [methanotrophic bacterial endosymbiont of Bathymodiolus sp.]|nr:secreted protein [methanotrophic bacterial endosymbiont of Bathymodiolus sp.]
MDTSTTSAPIFLYSLIAVSIVAAISLFSAASKNSLGRPILRP